MPQYQVSTTDGSSIAEGSDRSTGEQSSFLARGTLGEPFIPPEGSAEHAQGQKAALHQSNSMNGFLFHGPSLVPVDQFESVTEK